MKTGTYIKSAQYMSNYVIELNWSDGMINMVDFEKQIMAQKITEYKIYQDLNEFKK